MVVVVVLVARCGPLERAVGQDRLVRWHRQLGPWPLYLLTAHVRADHGRLRAGGARRRAAPVRPAAVDLPRHPRGDGRVRAADRGRRHLVPARAPADGLRDLVVGAPLHLPRAVPRRSRTRSTPARRSSGTRGRRAWWTALWVGDARARPRLPRRPAAVALAAPPPDRRGGRRRKARAPTRSRCAGRHLHRLPVAGGQFFQWRFLRRGLWWQAHPYSLSAKPARGAAADHRQGPRRPQRRARAPAARHAGRDRGPVRRLHRRHPPRRPRPAGRRRRRHHARSARCCEELPKRRRRRRHPARVDAARTWSCATRSPSSSPQRGGRLHELVGPRERVRLDAAALCARSSRASPTATSTSAGPTRFTEAIATAARDAGVDPDRIHHESFAV